MIEYQYNTYIKDVQRDGTCEFKPFTFVLEQFGIVFRKTYPHISKYNGMMESRHVRVVDIGLILLVGANVPKTYWTYAFRICIFLF